MTTASIEPSIRTAELREYQRQLRDISADLADLTGTLDELQLNWRPAPTRWSIAEGVVHLNAVAELLLPVLERRAVDARKKGLLAEGPFRHSRLGNFFLKMMEPPPKLRIPGPKGLLPQPQHYTREVIATFMRLQEEIIAAIDRADGLNLSAIMINSPFPRPLRLSIGQWYGFLAAHARRHLWQARNVRNDPDFPALAS